MAFNDSIRGHLSKDSLIAELKMQLAAPQNSCRAMILFEGEADISVFDSLIDNQNCILFESYGGKLALTEIIEKVITDKRLIGIRDRDYETAQSCQRIFFCDHCNLEMMIVSNDECFSALMFKLLCKKDDFIKLRDEVLLSLRVLSITRKLSEQLHWAFNFQNISIDYLLSRNNPVCVEDLIYHLRTQGNGITDDQIKRISEELSISTDLFNITNGHDFCKAILFELKKRYTRSNIKKISLQTFNIVLSLGFQEKHFKKTQLYRDLAAYQKKSNLSVVL